MEYEVRDPIHATITFDEREKKVIDHPFVQRLRFIRQLGLKSFVYPGAVHDRFSHALGAMHLAGRVFDVLDAQSDIFSALRAGTRSYVRRVFRLAALLHDVGHGPFSHASETLMPALGKLHIPRGWYASYDGATQATHEDYGVLLIATLASPREHIFTSTEAQDIASFMHKKTRPSATWRKLFKTSDEAAGYHLFLRRLISGELDVDRMDYLLRDSHFTGVPYGQYDLEWLLRSLSARRIGAKPILVVSDGGLRAFEDFLLARYHMFLQVYFHRTTALFEYYVEQAITKHEVEVIIPHDPYQYADLRDGGIIEKIFDAAKDSKNKWSRFLVAREPSKFLYRLERGDAGREARYRTIIKTLKHYRIPYFERSARRTLSEQHTLRPGGAGIMVAERFLDCFEYAQVERRSELLKKYNEKIDRVYVYVFREDYARALSVLKKAIN